MTKGKGAGADTELARAEADVELLIERKQRNQNVQDAFRRDAMFATQRLQRAELDGKALDEQLRKATARLRTAQGPVNADG